MGDDDVWEEYDEEQEKENWKTRDDDAWEEYDDDENYEEEEEEEEEEEDNGIDNSFDAWEEEQQESVQQCSSCGVTPSQEAWPYHTKPQEEGDGWMTSFEDLAPRQQVNEPLMIVDPQSSFTDGERLFEPIQSGESGPLYTDGEQLYVVACMPVDELVPIEGVELPCALYDTSTPMSSHEPMIDLPSTPMNCYDPGYDPNYDPNYDPGYDPSYDALTPMSGYDAQSYGPQSWDGDILLPAYADPDPEEDEWDTCWDFKPKGHSSQ